MNQKKQPSKQHKSTTQEQSPVSPTEKIQKLLAKAGVCSRREAERWIADGRVEVDGKPAHLGQRLAETAAVKVDGKRIQLQAPTAEPVKVLIYNKPIGVICSRNDPEGRKTIFDKLPKLNSGRWISVGRLDLNSSGLLLLTNSGELAHRLMHPSYEIKRTYRVRIDGTASQEQLAQLCKGLELEDGLAKFDKVRLQGKTESRNCWYEVELHEGKNREIRRMWQALGYHVSRLVRIKYANINLPKELKPGETVLASPAQIQQLQKLTR